MKYRKAILIIFLFIILLALFKIGNIVYQIFPYLYHAYSQNPHTPFPIVKHLIINKSDFIKAEYMVSWDDYDLYAVSYQSDIDREKKFKKNPNYISYDAPSTYKFFLYKENEYIIWVEAPISVYLSLFKDNYFETHKLKDILTEKKCTNYYLKWAEDRIHTIEAQCRNYTPLKTCQ